MMDLRFLIFFLNVVDELVLSRVLNNFLEFSVSSSASAVESDFIFFFSFLFCE